MELSLKLQDEGHQKQNPLLKAKLPITIFDQPFKSSLTATTTTPKDLSFCLSTNFPSGPSLKLSYIPSISTTTTPTAAPFSLSLKSGLSLFGSPHNSPLIFSANFSISSTNHTTVIPTFSLHFKPHLGHFSLFRSTSSNPNPDPISGSHSESGSPSNSEFVNRFVPDGPLDSWEDLKLDSCNGDGNGFQNPNPIHFNGVHSNTAIDYVKESPLMLKSNKKCGFLNGVALKARTVLPVTKKVMLNLRWGVKFEAASGFKLPYLTLNKIGIERVKVVNKVEEK
ncbi:hypothetical protein CFOL_v3_32148 [Cephalotus follicularis]|uniref:Uncharacterized protein n=1 Tax=Cephalotus follicularis TaxID=3775 RepID=A0A1Q3D897_CEPFO|nr:hypothetical protein CFOL_v3_32148 [Cephalotus follicularis]